MTVRGIKPGSEEIDWQDKGVVAKVIYRCDWQDVQPGFVSVDLPKHGDPWSDACPMLKVVHAHAQRGQENECEYAVDYSTGGQLAEGFFEVRFSGDVKCVNRLKGWTWQDAGTPVQIDINEALPIGRYSLRMKQLTDPKAAMIAAAGMVNSKVFHTFQPGTLMFNCIESEASYDDEGLPVSWMTQYFFQWDPEGFFVEWRDPLYKRWMDGELLGEEIYWHDKALPNIPEDPYVTTDPALCWTKVPAEGVPGTGGFDTPIDPATGDKRYAECDFAAVLGLAKLPGDD
jgi:hypothetical protein